LFKKTIAFKICVKCTFNKTEIYLVFFQTLFLDEDLFQSIF